MGAIKGNDGQRRVYYKIINDNKPFRVKAKPGAPGAEKRVFVPKDGGNPIDIWEYKYIGIEGILKEIKYVLKEFKTGKVPTIEIVLRDSEIGEPDMVLQLNMVNNVVSGNSLLEKIFNADLSKKMQITYYNFEGKNGKNIRGFNVKQGDYSSDDSKVYSKFFDPEKRIPINGIPYKTAEERQYMTSNKWKVFFEEVTEFLMNYYDNVIEPKLKEFSPELPMVDVYENQVDDAANTNEYDDSDQQYENVPGGVYDDEADDLPF